MARLPRLFIKDCPQHIIQRGNNRQATFFADEDYTVYLDKLKDFSVKYQVKVHAYVLMTNHVHLLLSTEHDGAISKMMQSIGRYFVLYINNTYQRTGTLWEGRYKSTLVDSDNYLFTVMRYIEMNPVRAGMVDHPEEYPWSSYQANAVGKAIELLTPHEQYVKLADTHTERLSRYVGLFDEYLSDNTIELIRAATNKAWILGSELFKRQVETQINRRVEPANRGGDRKSEGFREQTRNQTL
tara:strand:+ start:49679 stop:50401 length:723 start_codon:yes stop_codon:yes gene_type:complete